MGPIPRLLSAFKGSTGTGPALPPNDSLPPGMRAELLNDSALTPPFRKTFVNGMRLAAPYWTGVDKYRAWGLSAAVLATSLLQIATQFAQNLWMASLMQGFASKDIHGFVTALELAPLVYIGTSLASAAVGLSGDTLKLDWQRSMTNRLVDEWLGEPGEGTAKPYLEIETGEKQLDSTDQRLTDTVEKFTTVTTDVAIGTLVTTLSLGTFTSLLWSLSNASEVTIFNHTLPQGFLCYAALGYAALGLLGTHGFGRHLAGIAKRQLHYDGDFRYLLMRVRDNAISIASYGGEIIERGILSNAFGRAVANKWENIKTNTRVNMFNALYQHFGSLLPYAVAAPLYFADKATFGTVSRIGDAFARVQGNLNWFIVQYPVIAGWSANVIRLHELKTEIDRVNAQHDNSHRNAPPADAAPMNAAPVATPDNVRGPQP